MKHKYKKEKNNLNDYYSYSNYKRLRYSFLAYSKTFQIPKEKIWLTCLSMVARNSKCTSREKSETAKKTYNFELL